MKMNNIYIEPKTTLYDEELFVWLTCFTFFYYALGSEYIVKYTYNYIGTIYLVSSMGLSKNKVFFIFFSIFSQRKKIEVYFA